jgi:hypothetical protein
MELVARHVQRTLLEPPGGVAHIYAIGFGVSQDDGARAN